MKSIRGFTLIELLVVMAILVLLATFMIPQVTRLNTNARIKKTEALIQRIAAALNSYHADFQDYPPDGFDGGPSGDRGYSYEGGGVRLGRHSKPFKNTGCLVYFLMQPLAKVSRLGSNVGANDSRNKSISRVGPYLQEQDMNNDDWNIDGFSIGKLRQGGGTFNHVEICDAFGRPLEYDKVRSRVGFFNSALFDSQGGGGLTVSGVFGTTSTEIHWPESGERMAPAGEGYQVEYEGAPYSPLNEELGTFYDPRRPRKNFGGSVAIDLSVKPAPKNVGQFDLWSHGPHWSDPNDDIGNW